MPTNDPTWRVNDVRDKPRPNDAGVSGETNRGGRGRGREPGGNDNAYAHETDRGMPTDLERLECADARRVRPRASGIAPPGGVFSPESAGYGRHSCGDFRADDHGGRGMR